MTTDEIRAVYDDVLAELDELAETWLEWRAAGRPTDQLSTAIDQATGESRRFERKLRKLP